MSTHTLKLTFLVAQVPGPNGTSTLSLYITSLVVDFSQSDYEMPATMMVAIKNAGDKAGERGARAEWVWEVWQNDWIFRQESEVWGVYFRPWFDRCAYFSLQNALCHRSHPYWKIRP
jgi:hypothetical protein